MSRSKLISCFFEDVAHEQFVVALIKRAARQKGVPEPTIRVLSATQGSRVWIELRQYARDLVRERARMPDILVMVVDSDCKGVAEVRRRVRDAVQQLSALPVVCGIPDPHIERWYVEDQRALKSVLPGAQVNKLSYACERRRYKQVLLEAILSVGVEPLLGGAEYGAEIAAHLDPARMDTSFQDFWNELLRVF